MKRQIRCEEWGALSIGAQCDIHTSDEVTQILSSWKRKTGLNPAAFFERRNDFLIPKFWSGSIDTPSFQLEVAPIGSSALDSSQRSCLDANLSGMLANAMSSQATPSGIAHISPHGLRHESLVASFCEGLLAARRKLILRRYTPNQASLSSPKGKIVFPEQCYEDIRRPGKVFSRWVALTDDTPENRLFKEALRQYKPRCSASLRSKIDFCLSEMDSVTPLQDFHSEWVKVRLDRLPHYYRQLLDLCRALLEGKGGGFFAGSFFASSQILFTSRVFEKYIANELSFIAPRFGLIAKPQPRGTFLCSSDTEEGFYEQIPDVLVSDLNGKTKVVLDTKWKYLKHDVKNLGIDRKDINQVLIYGSTYECSNIILLFPDITNDTGESGFSKKLEAKLGQQTYSIHIVKLPFLNRSLETARKYLQSFLSQLIG